LTRRRLDLHEGDADVGERVAHRGGIVAEAVAEAVDQAADGVDGERRRDQVGLLGRQVDGASS
jgi:hypothetical protein